MSTVDRDRLVDFTRELVRIPSVLGDERAMATSVLAEMRRLGFEAVEVDAAGNAVGTIEGNEPGPTVLFDAHMDTVDVLPREAWQHDPFGADLEHDRIYGRGSADMKGSLAAMLFGAASLDRTRLAGRMIVSASVGEELIEGAALRAVLQRHPADFVVIGEASGLDLVRAGRGRAEFVIVTHGQPAHASSPARGVNAIHLMRRVIEQIEALEMPSHPFVGSGVMCVTDIISMPYPAHSVVPSGCRATYERRLVPGETLDGLVTEIGGAAARADAPMTSIEIARTGYRSYTGVEWDEPKWFPAWELAEDHALVQRAMSGLRGIGLEPGLASYQFCTNGAHSAGVAGVPTIGFGPSHEGMAHIVDEYLEVGQLVDAARGYAAISRSLLGRG